MALSVRIFGLSSWSILVPQALMGVATTGVLYAAVRRHSSAGAALLSGAVLLLTPVAALMFRFNNPDALLVLLMTLAAYTVLRAVESGRTRWLLAAGALVGLGFLTKQLQVFLVLPALSLTYLLFSPRRTGARLLQLLAAGAAVVVSAGWWVALVELWPASSRPYIGGSTDNSFLGLTLGYNGLGRLTGEETGSVGGGGGGTSMWGETGITRLFHRRVRRAGRLAPPRGAGDGGGRAGAAAAPAAPGRPARPGGAVADLAAGHRPGVQLHVGDHPRLLHRGPGAGGRRAGGGDRCAAVARARPSAALAGSPWRPRGRRCGRSCCSRAAATSCPGWSWVVLVAGVLAAVGLVALPLRPALTTSVAVVALVASLAGPLAYTAQTVSTAHTGRSCRRGDRRRGDGRARWRRAARRGVPRCAAGTQQVPPRGDRDRGCAGLRDAGWRGRDGWSAQRSTPSAELVALLEQDASSYTWSPRPSAPTTPPATSWPPSSR